MTELKYFILRSANVSDIAFLISNSTCSLLVIEKSNLLYINTVSSHLTPGGVNLTIIT